MGIPKHIPVIYFDGVCNLCNGMVQFIIKHDRKKLFRFAALQSEPGKALCLKFKNQLPDTILLEYNQRVYTKSGAVLRIALLLGGVWVLAGAAYIIPGVLRDNVYDWVAHNRYKWYGRRDKCMMPAPELETRFLK